MVPVTPLEVVVWSLAGAALGLAVSWVPGFHIVNLVILIMLLAPGFIIQHPYLLPYFALGALVAFSFMSSVAVTSLVFQTTH